MPAALSVPALRRAELESRGELGEDEAMRDVLDPAVLGPLIGLVAVICWGVNKGYRSYLDHEERMAKIEAGLDPDDDID